MPDFTDLILQKLSRLVLQGRWEELESDTLEIKPVPSDGGSWRKLHESINAFLNTRGGVVILGVKEEGQGSQRRYVASGYPDAVEPKLKEFPSLFTDRQGQPVDLTEQFPAMQIKEFVGRRVAVIWVDELSADRKFVFYRSAAYKRVLTGDHRIQEPELDAQDAYREEAWQARELQPMVGVTPTALDLDVLNEYIQHLNRPTRIETIKASLEQAESFLTRRNFIRDGQVTTLGMLVCGTHPQDYLGFRCHVHGYVDVPQTVAQDKQDLMGNILPLMDASFAYIWRNIQVGVSASGGGSSVPEYPEEIVRETINNALAHRDYSIDKQAIISIRPGRSISIQNPGRFRSHLLIEAPHHEIPLRRVIPEAKARNPKLADVLRVYRRWEGRGIGMATLVNLCLENRLDLPTYRLRTEEVCLNLTPGQLLDERMEMRFRAYDAYLASKMKGRSLTRQQKLVLSYLMKAEWAGDRLLYTIILTPDNNHHEEVLTLLAAGLIFEHPLSTPIHPVYVVDRVLMKRDYQDELIALFGDSINALDNLLRDTLDVAYRHQEFSTQKRVTAKMVAFTLWYERPEAQESIREFDTFYRRVRYGFNKLEKAGFIRRDTDKQGFRLNELYREERLL